MQNLIGYHLTSSNTAEIIMDEGIKGSKWTDSMEDLASMSSDPFNLYDDGAVWCYPSLEVAKENLEDDEVVLEVCGEGYIVEHEAHGTCFVLQANTCEVEYI